MRSGREELELLGEIVDGEYVREERPSLRMESFRDADSETLTIRIEVDQRWYREAPRADWDRLNSCIVELQRLGGMS